MTDNNDPDPNNNSPSTTNNDPDPNAPAHTPIIYVSPNYQTGTAGGSIWTIPITNAPVGPITITFPSVITSAPPLEEVCCDLPEEKDEAGCSCKKCGTWNEYAEPNQPDKTFICYKCSHGL